MILEFKAQQRSLASRIKTLDNPTTVAAAMGISVITNPITNAYIFDTGASPVPDEIGALDLTGAGVIDYLENSFAFPFDLDQASNIDSNAATFSAPSAADFQIGDGESFFFALVGRFAGSSGSILAKKEFNADCPPDPETQDGSGYRLTTNGLGTFTFLMSKGCLTPPRSQVLNVDITMLDPAVLIGIGRDVAANLFRFYAFYYQFNALNEAGGTISLTFTNGLFGGTEPLSFGLNGESVGSFPSRLFWTGFWRGTAAEGITNTHLLSLAEYLRMDHLGAAPKQNLTVEGGNVSSNLSGASADAMIAAYEGASLVDVPVAVTLGKAQP